MKTFLCISIFSAVTVLLSLQVLRIEASPNNNQSFQQWCLQKDSLPIETRKTVEILLERARTQDCKLANSKLNRRDELFIVKISDVKPLASLTNLNKLTIVDSKIKDTSSL
ncbi:MAG: leucine-rich repeat domain-containing protein, partial [Pseudanabaena sp.]